MQCTVIALHVIRHAVTDGDVNPLLVFAGFICFVALVLAVVLSSITIYRHRRPRHVSTGAGAAVELKRLKRDRVDVTDPLRTPPAAGREVIRMTATVSRDVTITPRPCL